MKKIICLVVAVMLLFSFVLVGCGTKTPTSSETQKPEVTKAPEATQTVEATQTPEATKAPEVTKSNPPNTNIILTIKDYFPYKANTKYMYEGIGNEYASYSVFTDYIVGNRVQLRTDNGGSELVKVLENKDGKLTILLFKGECYYRENLTQSSIGNTEILLKEPLTKGTTWTLANNRKRYISNMDVEVITPLGSFKTLEVTTEDKEDKTLDYYAPNIGLVKSVFITAGSEVSSTLIKMENNVPLIQTVKFYYPNVNDDKIYYVYKRLSFNTNDLTKIIFEKAFKDITNGNLGKVLGPNAKIKSLYLNKNNMVYVDFTRELVSEMNAGAGYESMILQSITNTFGIYYGVDKVYITIEGSPYSSGHILMKKGEFFTVNLKNSFELK